MLASSFFACWPGASGRELPAGFEDALRRCCEIGQAAWPGIALDASLFAAFLGERAPREPDPIEALSRLRIEDLYLTCACTQGDAEAIRAFDRRYISKVPAYASRMGATRALLDDVQQMLRERLLVASSGEPPRISRYEGRGALDNWVRVSALRLAFDLRDSRSRQAVREKRSADDAALAWEMDPELGYLKVRYGAEFEAAFQDAFSALGEQDRNLLRFHFLEGLTPGRIGVLYSVHRTTAMRWLAAAQESLFAATRAALVRRLGLSPAECESLIQLVKSRLGITLHRLLRAEPG
jgi:RNA polymerase sigma-70 factor (ECF subfamily)